MFRNFMCPVWIIYLVLCSFYMPANARENSFFISSDPQSLLTGQFDLAAGIGFLEKYRTDLGGQIIASDLERNRGYYSMYAGEISGYYYFQSFQKDSGFVKASYKKSNSRLSLSEEYRMRAQNRSFKHTVHQNIQTAKTLLGYQWQWESGLYLNLAAGPMFRLVEGEPLKHITTSGILRAEGFKEGTTTMPIIEFKLGVKL